ncbi:MAG: DNA topoisomerase IB [Sinomonas sp.]|nr:DNA topoisomerase IB [Sinomonas sp.]
MARTHRSLRAASTRRCAGRGFTYTDASGQRISAPGDLERIRALAIPPAWREVRIATTAGAKVQAMGVDDAGRTQYLYHSSWRARQDARKFDRALTLANRLTTVRRAVTRDLRGRRGPRAQALAAAILLVDRAGVRAGGRRYAQENGTFGVTTLQSCHVRVEGDEVFFDFPGKSGAQWEFCLRDADLARYLAGLPARPAGHPAFGYDDGGGFQRLGASALNSYLREISRMNVSVKDLRTWRGTAVAAGSLDASRRAGVDAETAWKRAVDRAAQWLTNTPAVARGSYVDPRLLEAYRDGKTATTDCAAARLLAGQ